jgi:hypothetical protein
MKLLKKVNALVLVMSVLLAVGCGKESKQDDPEPVLESPINNVPATVKCQLIESESIDSIRSIPDVYKGIYQYNSAGKIEEINRWKNNLPGAKQR